MILKHLYCLLFKYEQFHFGYRENSGTRSKKKKELNVGKTVRQEKYAQART